MKQSWINARARVPYSPGFAFKHRTLDFDFFVARGRPTALFPIPRSLFPSIACPTTVTFHDSKPYVFQPFSSPIATPIFRARHKKHSTRRSREFYLQLSTSAFCFQPAHYMLNNLL